MRRSRIRTTVLVVFLVVVSACGTGYTLTLTEEQREAVKVDGWNQIGRTDLDADDWFEIVSTTCANQPHTEATRSSVVAEWELDRLVPTDDAVSHCGSSPYRSAVTSTQRTTRSPRVILSGRADLGAPSPRVNIPVRWPTVANTIP